MHRLSERLTVIASLVSDGARVCDVGTDHGYLPVFLSESGKTEHIIATDIREKPLSSAEKNISDSGVKGIELRLCDGLSAVKENEADTVIIAGMGGEVISGIISRCPWLKNPDVKLILQPMTSGEFLRKFLYDNGFEILTETPVSENGKLYSVILSRYNGKSLAMPEWFYYIGKLDAVNPVAKLYIEKQLSRCKECADALHGIDGKQTEYSYYKKAADGISAVLAGEKTE